MVLLMSLYLDATLRVGGTEEKEEEEEDNVMKNLKPDRQHRLRKLMPVKNM